MPKNEKPKLEQQPEPNGDHPEYRRPSNVDMFPQLQENQVGRGVSPELLFNWRGSEDDHDWLVRSNLNDEEILGEMDLIIDEQFIEHGFLDVMGTIYTFNGLKGSRNGENKYIFSKTLGAQVQNRSQADQVKERFGKFFGGLRG